MNCMLLFDDNKIKMASLEVWKENPVWCTGEGKRGIESETGTVL